MYLKYKNKYNEAMNEIDLLNKQIQELKYEVNKAHNNERCYLKKESSIQIQKKGSEVNMNNSQDDISYNNVIPNNEHIINTNSSNDIENTPREFENEYGIQLTQSEQENCTQIEMIPLEKYDKLKEDYLIMVNEKTELENELMLLNDYKSKFISQSDEILTLKDNNEKLNEQLNYQLNENSILRAQISKVMSNKSEMLLTTTTLRDQIKAIENEKTQLKINHSHHLAKFTYMENEISMLKEKNISLTDNIKKILDKHKQKNEETNELLKEKETQIEELKLKNEQLIYENKSMFKDVIASFINVTRERNLHFCYKTNKNKIQLKHADDVVIFEFDNQININNNNINKEGYKQTVMSPVHVRKFDNGYYYKNEICNLKSYLNDSSCNNGECGITSLNKLFSRSYSNSSNRSKENNCCNIKEINSRKSNNVLNLNLITLNANSFVKQMNVYDNNYHESINVNTNYSEKISSLNNCIKQTNLQEWNTNYYEIINELSFEITNTIYNNIKSNDLVKHYVCGEKSKTKYKEMFINENFELYDMISDIYYNESDKKDDNCVLM